MLALCLQLSLSPLPLLCDRDAQIQVMSTRIYMIERVTFHFERFNIGAQHDLVSVFVSTKLIEDGLPLLFAHVSPAVDEIGARHRLDFSGFVIDDDPGRLEERRVVELDSGVCLGTDAEGRKKQRQRHNIVLHSLQRQESRAVAGIVRGLCDPRKKLNENEGCEEDVEDDSQEAANGSPSIIDA